MGLAHEFGADDRHIDIFHEIISNISKISKIGEFIFTVLKTSQILNICEV